MLEPSAQQGMQERGGWQQGLGEHIRQQAGEEEEEEEAQGTEAEEETEQQQQSSRWSSQELPPLRPSPAPRRPPITSETLGDRSARVAPFDSTGGKGVLRAVTTDHFVRADYFGDLYGD